MVGILFGAILFGYISDKYGRIVAVIIGIALVSLSSLIGAFMPTAAGFVFFRFLSGKLLLKKSREISPNLNNHLTKFILH